MPYKITLALLLFGAVLCVAGATAATLFVGFHAVSFWTFTGLAFLTGGALCLAVAFLISALLVWEDA